MECSFSIEDFNNYIRTIKYHHSLISFATNSIRIIFLSEKNKKLYFFHIDPPWRIIYKNKILINSDNYPFHSNYGNDQREEECQDFQEWCQKIEFMKNEGIKNIILNPNSDMNLEWNNGAILNVFTNDIEMPTIFFYDKVAVKVYEFKYGECTQDDLKKSTRIE